MLVAIEVPDPLPAPGGVVVDVAVASITFVETSVRAGRPPHPSTAPELPAILGNGVGGLVAATGAGVDAGMRGTRVITTAGGPAKLELATELRATAAVDYTAPDWPEQVREASDGGVDVVLDGVGGAPGEAAFGLLNAGGRFVPYGMASGAFAAIDADEDRRRRHQRRPRRAARARGEPRAHRGGARRGGGRPAAGRGAELPRGRAADAHVAIEARATIGKTLLRVVNLRGDR